MGGKNGKERHILDNTSWLRNVIQQDPKLRKSVRSFESFTIEPFFCQTARATPCHQQPSPIIVSITDINDNQAKNDVNLNDSHQNEHVKDDQRKRIVISKINNINCLSNAFDGKQNVTETKNHEEYSLSTNLMTLCEQQRIKHFNVTICYRTKKNRVQKIQWVIKTSTTENKNSSEYLSSKVSVSSLVREIDVYEVLISELAKFLAEQSKHPQAKYLLNLPGFIHSEKREVQNARNSKSKGLYEKQDYQHCYLVLENIASTKQCYPVNNEQVISGLTLSQFKVFLATLAQIHGVGISWKMMRKDTYLEMMDGHPWILYENELLMKEDRREVEKYLKMYEKLLKWYFKNNDDVRQIKLFHELKARFFDNQAIQTENDYNFTGLCLGKLTALGINYQQEYPFNETNIIEDLEMFANIKQKETRDSIPVCAAINEVHLFHFGDIFKDLAFMFYSLPNRVCRAHYMVPLLELYCDVLRQTFEMLDLDWKNVFSGFNRVKIFQNFYNHVPNAIIDAIIVQMMYTNITELENICAAKTNPGMWNDTESGGDLNKHLPTISKFIPLSKKRIHFLISLLDLTYKPI